MYRQHTLLCLITRGQNGDEKEMRKRVQYDIIDKVIDFSEHCQVHQDL